MLDDIGGDRIIFRVGNSVIPKKGINMGARDKYEEAQFFYNKVIDNTLDESEVGYYFSAFISAINSITDFALEEANIHFDLKIPSKTRSLRNRFQNIVNISEDHELLGFYSLWGELKCELEENPAAHYRHINIHRQKIEIARGEHFALIGSDAIEMDLVQQYKNYFLKNEGWAPPRYFNVSQYANAVNSISDVYRFDPHLRDDTLSFRAICNTKGQSHKPYLFTTLFFKDETDVFDPISITCNKMLKLSSQYIECLHGQYKWIEL